jgi:superoxide dismutase, Cu-Zn family
VGSLHIKWGCLILACLAVTGCAGNVPVSDDKPSVTVNLLNSQGVKIGTAVLTEEKVGEGVKIQLKASQLSPGPHGFHIHETGQCTPPDFKSAGGHFNPHHKAHGKLNTNGAHAGDLDNIVADAKGNVHSEQVAKGVTLAKGQLHSLFKSGGTSLVIHEGPDDLKTDPAGNSGKRVACGAIQP